ncbi:DUF937 domain-containing protein [Streptomyces sp. NPDC050095]|uniref:DUF937 domain-containing protein n=1 Tax=unclassified Streptomyces TaxID=2593676 RepID=UPI003440669B
MSEESTSPTSPSFEQDVIAELGDDKLQELAGLLGTDAAGAQSVVGSTVSELSGAISEAEESAQEPPLQGVATLGGLGGMASGGLMAGVLAKMSRPVANAVAKKTGLPAANVARGIEMLIPIVLAVVAKRGAGRKSSPSGD